MNYASRTSRLFGQMIDAAIGAAPFLLGMLLGAIGFPVPITGLLFWLGALWSIYYYFFADGMTGGQSFAKRWLGMHVLIENTGQPCSYWLSFLRNLPLWLLGPIDWIFIFGGKHQRLGDKLAGTIVVLD
jgi:uncharacterized RDD family membrane protein YckC